LRLHNLAEPKSGAEGEGDDKVVASVAAGDSEDCFDFGARQIRR